MPPGPCSISEPSTACWRSDDSPVLPSRVTKPAAPTHLVDPGGEFGEERVGQVVQHQCHAGGGALAQVGRGPVVDVALALQLGLTRARVWRLTSGLLRNTSDTVARDTSQRGAMSTSVTLRRIGVWVLVIGAFGCKTISNVTAIGESDALRRRNMRFARSGDDSFTLFERSKWGDAMARQVGSLAASVVAGVLALGGIGRSSRARRGHAAATSIRASAPAATATRSPARRCRSA